MASCRPLRKFVLVSTLSFFAFFLLTLLAIQIEQQRFRHDAESLLAQVQRIELRKTTWQEAQSLLLRWDSKRKFDEPCLPQKCSFQIVLNEFALSLVSERNLFVKLDDYFRWRLKLSYAVGPFERLEFWLVRLSLRIGSRPSRVMVAVGMRDNVIWSKGVWVSVETYGSALDLSEYTLMAEIYSGPRFDYYIDHRVSAKFMSHPDYAIGSPDGCEICVMGWVKFTPFASPEDVHRLSQLDLSCLTRWHPCTTQSDIMPAAWAQYTTERSLASQNQEVSACSPLIVEILGRDSANIAAGEVVSYRENFYSNGYDKIVAKVRLIRRLKGLIGWNAGETRDITLLSGTICAPEAIQVGSKLIVYGGWDRSHARELNPKQPWPAILMTDTDLSLIQRGIEQDYDATDETSALGARRIYRGL